MNQEQTNITTGKQIRHLRTQLGMTQEENALADSDKALDEAFEKLLNNKSQEKKL